MIIWFRIARATTIPRSSWRAFTSCTSNNNGFQQQRKAQYYIPRNERKNLPLRYTLAPRKDRTSPSRDPNYTRELWSHHKSPWRHLRHLSLLTEDAVLQRLLFPDLTIVFAVSTSLTYYNEIIAMGLPEQQIMMQPTGALGTAMALLVGYRTNTAYGRYRECRNFWGTVVNVSRDFGRNVCMFVPEERGRVRLLRWIKMYPIVLNFFLTTKGGHHQLRRSDPEFAEKRFAEFRAEILDTWCNGIRYLKPDGTSSTNMPEEEAMEDPDVKRIFASFRRGDQHTPLLVLTILSEGISECSQYEDMDPMYIRMLDNHLMRITEANGERILLTPLPTGFTRHASRLTSLWAYISPLAIYSFLGPWTPVASMILSYSVLAIEDLGVQMEEPFNLLPLRQYSDGISNAVDQISTTFHREPH